MTTPQAIGLAFFGLVLGLALAVITLSLIGGRAALRRALDQ